MKPQIKILIGVLFLVIFTASINSIAQDKPQLIITYSVNETKHKITFSQKTIDLNLGDSFSIATDNLIFGAGLEALLDVNWEPDPNNKWITVYTFKAIKSGTMKLKCHYTNYQIEGDIKISIRDNPSNQNNPNPYLKIFYDIDDQGDDLRNNQRLIFSEQKVVMLVGQKILLFPKKESKLAANLLTEVSDERVISEDYFIHPKGNLYVFKANTVGISSIKCRVAHAAFIKGSIDVRVIK